MKKIAVVYWSGGGNTEAMAKAAVEGAQKAGSDAALMSRIVDGYLIVIRHNRSEFSKINETLRQMNFADAKILGFVYNVKEEQKKYYKKGKYSRYYYSYYYKKNE